MSSEIVTRSIARKMEGETAKNVSAEGRTHAEQQVPPNIPSIGELKKSLPDHCFTPSLSLSFYYVLKDLVIMTLLYVSMLALTEGPLALHWILQYLAVYPIYWFLQGTMMWAIFVLGHDCGHGSFSHNWVINDIVGNFLHSIILVPYYPWKMSHHHHHKNTGNIDKDEIFYPVRMKEANKKGGFAPFFGLGGAWFAYLVAGYGDKPRTANHFNPFDPLFARRAAACGASLACLAAFLSLVLVPYAVSYGFANLALHYILPVFAFASWLVVTTFLHHQDENVPWYVDEKWDFVRGNLSSVDRHYGWAHDLVHNIGTHQIHHLFIKIPHYRLEEATAVFREKYPHLVRKSTEPILPAFSKMFKLFNDQRYIENDVMVHVYNTK